jgi:hypothetical protein
MARFWALTLCCDQMFQIWQQCIAYSSMVTEQLQVDAKVMGQKKNLLVA